MADRDPRLDPNSPAHQDYVTFILEVRTAYESSTTSLWKKTLDWWDLFLAIQEDTRDPIDEDWRSNVFVPLPYIVSRTKAAQLVKNLANVEPVWQTEATRESGDWYEQSKHFERLVEYTHRMNTWRKLLYKLAIARSVQGTSFFKVTYGRRAHTMTLFPGQDEWVVFQKSIQNAVTIGAPRPPSWSADPEGFEGWRQLVNKAERFGHVTAPPLGGPQQIVEYEGPIFQYLPMWTVRVDPVVDEMNAQKVIIHRMIKPVQYILDRADNDMKSQLPYLLDNVKDAMAGWDGQQLEAEERQLAEKLGLNPAERNNPYYRNAAEITEIWSPEMDFKFAVIMNKKTVINKRPFERPLLSMNPNIFALRNVIVPGNFYGLSDYQETETLMTELNSFRRMRADGAMLTTLPAFVKQAGVNFTETMKKIRPGIVFTLPSADGIQSLIRHVLPPEAYREPAEIKAEVEDATETYSSVKGAPATVGRVTGVEYQGREGNTLIKYLVDAGFVEEELERLPATILGLYALFTPNRLRLDIGGDPDAVIDVTRDKLIQAIGMRFRMRGATRHIQPDLQVQQLTTALKAVPPGTLTPMEYRAALQLILELLDVRGFSKILTPGGAQQIGVATTTANNAANQGNVAAGNAAEASGVPAPAVMEPGQAAAAGGTQ